MVCHHWTPRSPKLPALQSSGVAVSYTHLRAHETVLDLVCRLLLEKKENLPANQTRSWTTYNRVLQHVRKHYLRLKTVNQLAKETHLDPAYLSRVFKSFHKESPYAFLVRLKMGHAASLLLKSDTLVKDVAYELGFDNPCHFSRSFKKAFGVAPEKFSERFDA